MFKDTKLDRLVQEGSSTVYFSLNPAVASNEIWTKAEGLEKAIGAKNPGDAVTLIGIKGGLRNPESYFLHGVYELIPFSDKSSESGGLKEYSEVHKSMVPGVAYVNPISLGISGEDLDGMDKTQTGPVKNRGKEFLGVVNLDYLIGLEKGKIGQCFRNGAYLRTKPTDEKGRYIEPTAKYSIMQKIGQGAGMISSKITDGIADMYGYAKPKQGDIVVGIAYFEDSTIGYRSRAPYAFPLVVSSMGDKMQVPSDVINGMYFEVILGLDKKLGNRLIA